MNKIDHWRWLGSAAALALIISCGEGATQKADAAEEAPQAAAEATDDNSDSVDPKTLPFMDTSLSAEERARDLVSRMTLEEKAAQMYDKAAAIPRLGIHEYNWWNEALHGVARAGHATVFPQAIGLAATWDEDLMFDITTVISDEARAKYNLYSSEDVYAMYGGLTFWSPNINIFRDPRWGRGQETYGEDPFLTGRMAVNFVNGMQGDDPSYLKTVTTVKHYAVHSGPEPSRHRDDISASDADLYETYLPAFKMAFDETEVASVMCAYNAVWGAPACGSERLMVDLLRGELGFDGYVVSDCGAIGDFYYDEDKMKTGEAHYIGHDYVDTRAEAAAVAVKMGTDVNCGDGYGNKMDALPAAVEQGLIDEATIDQSVIRLYTALFRLGMYDDPSLVPWSGASVDDVASEAHLALTEDAARKSLVLLKNDGVLPLADDVKVAVIGPNADNWWTLVANYYGIPTASVTALEGIREKIGEENVFYAPGSTIAGDVYANYETVPAAALFHRADDGSLQPGVQASYYIEPERTGEVVKTGVEETIDAYWLRTPTTDNLNDEFGATWTGVIKPTTDGTYRFKPSRWTELSINGEVVEGDQEFTMTAGEEYDFQLAMTFNSGWSRDALEKFVNLSWVDVSRDLKAEAMAAAEKADVVLFFGGIDANLEGEEMSVEIDGFLGGDRTHLELPAPQEALLKSLHATGKPVVLVNFSGSAMALNWEDENLPAIVQAFYPGEKAGVAIADLLWGEYSPSGRLPVTFYKSVDDLPAFLDYSMANRTYKYFTGKPLYPFGYGLSYTTFGYGNLEIPSEHDASGELAVSVEVTNTGERAGREVVQLYMSHDKRANPTVPRVELVGFEVVELEPGESTTVEFSLSPERVGYFDEDGKLVIPQEGSATFSVGGGQPAYYKGAVSTKVSFAGN
ncbi:glycoside hydrolase family 3 C-terminal domain-containing protein [Parvularcula sp. LCG005]|uniref:glycoside hydrolase family 3 C-terminal domain-containing protein n=1 Tax=Parvularcula sp. LCG005 TaxID=3078805 RepID=UPI002942564F|nr:glycoside hydrolase family 3 C-terminal domain-containing protein [Parvularcula sp. LCG005]WOI53373.1 glycoside hydrolase family 3 C-terminal domain-containing protein [Parvularcula sp. LCG005]